MDCMCASKMREVLHHISFHGDAYSAGLALRVLREIRETESVVIDTATLAVEDPRCVGDRGI